MAIIETKMPIIETIIAIMISKISNNEFMMAIIETKMPIMETIIAIMISKSQIMNS